MWPCKPCYSSHLYLMLSVRLQRWATASLCRFLKYNRRIAEATIAVWRLILNAGMSVILEIHQGKRTVMEYLLSPVLKVRAEAARER